MNYNFKENLNMFEQAVCLKSTPLKDLSISSISIFWKIAILFVLVWAVVTTAVNIAAYAKILNTPDDKQDLSSAWCIAMLIFNGCLLLVSLLLIVIVILSFKKESDAKKAVQTTVKGEKKIAAAEGAAVGASEAAKVVTMTAVKAAADAAATAVMNSTGDSAAATNAAKVVFAAGVTAGTSPDTTAAATTAAINSATTAANSGNLQGAANAAVSGSTSAARGTLGGILSMPPNVPQMTTPIVQIGNGMNFPGGPNESLFNQVFNKTIDPGFKCSDNGSPPCGDEKNYAVNLYHDLISSPDSRFTGTQFAQKLNLPPVDLLSFN